MEETMRLANTTERFGAVAQGLHWIIAALIVVQWLLIEWAEAAEGARKSNPAAAMEQLAWLARHKSVGITILALAALRLGWRVASRPPPWPAAMPRWQVHAARATHWLFYALLFALPISGWMVSSSGNHPVSYFGLFTLPDLVAPDKALHHRLEDIHEFCFDALVVLALVHIVAALKHQFVDRDGVLLRMLPWRS
jgi:cytochrome b561